MSIVNPATPPARRRIADLQPGERVEEEIFRVAQKDLRTTANGGLYIHAVLADKTGEVLARMWSANQTIYDSMPEGGFIYVRGRVENYKGQRQFIIDGVRAVEEGVVDPADFLPATKYDVKKMWERAKEILRTIKHPDLLALLAKFVKDEQFAANFMRAPAARQNHHAYIGGLLEHTLGLLELALVVTPRYPQVSQDLVLAGLFLHDAGKTAELAYDTNFEYTDEGQLMGHIVQVVIWLHLRAREWETETKKTFPREILNALTHIILAHHGKYEFGSPKLPAMPEAVLVHYLDDMDAKMNIMLHTIEADTDASKKWTEFIRTLETKVYKADVMNPRPPAQPPLNNPPN